MAIPEAWLVFRHNGKTIPAKVRNPSARTLSLCTVATIPNSKNVRDIWGLKSAPFYTNEQIAEIFDGTSA